MPLQCAWILLWLSLMLPGLALSQNLIPNGSFENYRNCPEHDNQLQEAPPWYNPNRATPDFYHQCFQAGQMQLQPHTGAGVAHLFFDQGWAEYLAVPLTRALDAGQCYYFEMYVALETPKKYLTQSLGVALSEQPIKGTTTGLMPAPAQITEDQLRTTDAPLQWKRVFGVVTARGGERYLTIGNFSTLPPFLGYYYLYIDDVALQAVKLDLGRDTTLCSRVDTYRLNAETPGAIDYKWNDGSTSPTLLVTKPGRYSVKVTTACQTLQDSITVDYALDFSLGRDTTLCQGQDLTLRAPAGRGGATYRWQDGSAQDTYVVREAGTYSVQVTQAGCTASGRIGVRYVLPPRLELGPDQELCGAEVFTIKPTIAEGRFTWQDGFAGEERTVSQSGVFRATVSNACATVLDSVGIDYEACGCALYAPDIFTPNNDGYNDLFQPFGCGDITITSLAIFNRWGQVIYQTSQPPFQWDGRYRDSASPAGVYTWSIQYGLNQRNKVTRKNRQGSLSLVR